jgi:hypothetical protein
MSRMRGCATIVTLLLVLSTLAGISTGPGSVGAASATRVTLSPTSGPVGRTVKVSFSRFTKNHSITISWDGKSVATSRTSAAGDGSVTITVPTAKKGSHKVAATMGRVSASATFTVVPKISLSRSRATVGEAITATLRGYSRGESVAIGLDSTAKTLVTVVASSTGSASAKIVLPPATGGTHKIVGIGGAGSRSQASLTIVPSIKVNPQSGPAGTNVRVSLRGYAAREYVEFQWHANGGTQSLGFATTDSTGTRYFTVTVPDAEPGTYGIIGRGYGVSVAETPFTVT